MAIALIRCVDPEPPPNRSMPSSPTHIMLHPSRLRWLVAIVATVWAVCLLPGPPASKPASATAPTPSHGASDGTTPTILPSASLPIAQPSAPASSPRVGVSPQLHREITWIRDALRGCLEDQPPLRLSHARLLGGWAFNLMLDAAYQDALDTGHETDPQLARKQVVQVLEEVP